MTKSTKKPAKPKKPIKPTPEPRMHPWRQCPFGYHHVNEHLVHCQPSTKNPNGLTTKRSEHCAKNPSGKDILRAKEIECIAITHFKNLKILPTKGGLVYEFGQLSESFDILIAGWVQYWNEIFEPKIPLPPDIIKALVASESSFNLDPKKTRGVAAGLTQITPDTHRYLKGEDGELKDFWIICTKKELLKPAVSICCGVRWMFRKRATLRARAKRDVSWIEVVSEYKSLNDKRVTKEDKERVEAVFLEHYKNTTKAK